MKNKFSLKEFPFVPKIWATLVYFLLFAVVFILFMGRTKEGLRVPFLLEICPDFYSHVSNFAISFMICMVVGYMNIMIVRNMKLSLIMVGILVFANLIYELFIPILNTPDIVDAYYGIIGSVLPIIYFYFYQNYGLMKNPTYSNQTLDIHK